MFLSKAPHGIYYLYYKDENGRTQKVTTKSRKKSEAMLFVTTFKNEKEKEKAPKTFSQFMVQFLEYSKPNLSGGTIQLYEIVRDHFIEILGDIPLHEITPYHWDKFKAVRLQHVSPVTVNIELRSLRSAVNKAFRWNLIPKSPFSMQPLCLVPEKYPEYFTKEEFTTFYKCIQEDWFKEIVLFGVLTGMRRGEITNLSWRYVDLERKTIHIVSSPTFKTKTGKKRIIPIHESLLPMLKTKWDISHEPDRLVFTLKEKKVYGNTLTHKFLKILRISGVNKKGLHVHSLRHTFASWLVQDGVPLYEVQKLLGHSTIQVTEIYAHLQPFQLNSAVNKIQI
jgi:integrase